MSSWLYAFPVLAWIGVAIFMSPAVWSVYVRQNRRGDQARVVCFLTALLMLGFLARRVVAGEPVDVSMAGLLLAATGVAAFTIVTAVNYGRGGRV